MYGKGGEREAAQFNFKNDSYKHLVYGNLRGYKHDMTVEVEESEMLFKLKEKCSSLKFFVVDLT